MANPKQEMPGRGRRPHGIAHHPYRTLAAAFAIWKVFLVAVVVGSCVGDAYDTSASLAVSRDSILTRFASWDAVYFVSIARRGYRFEQEWAFGAGLPVALRGVIQVLVKFGLIDGGSGNSQRWALLETAVGIAWANTAHFLSVLVLYRLGRLLWRSHPRGELFSLVAGLLHVISPAGIFLSAPYAESSCALFTFGGYLLYACSCHAAKPAASDGFLVLSGLSFGLATVFRSNGILNGLPFAWEVATLLPRLVQRQKSPPGEKRKRERADTSRTATTVRRVLALGIGGAAVGAGSLIPQAVAYRRFCAAPPSGAEAVSVPRPSWCDGYLPSIYAFVQAHYWNNGFLRYWTLSNLPLFLLAAPVLVVLAVSGVGMMRRAGTGSTGSEPGRLRGLIRAAAAAQVLLGLLVATNSHVQIISRISSGCPMWYFWLAERVLEGDKWGRRAVVFMVVYAAVQAALFALFLPPA
ncbi:GPI mannosyltransferase 2 [Echria macrotheca]|uniref:GPI mannosyltransferase 2 n=1 Tax=Echria macrotheca TaxID=438768 RepID=A0AAJ0F8Y6_9PEZI|nr:GPI mannosyltransferase 2 [Echria macrotheca]